MLAFLCHQLPERSFLWLWDPPWLCARCTGLYSAVLLGAVFLLWRTKPAKISLPFVAGAIVITLASIALEKLAGLEMGNGIRCLTATPLGFVLGMGLAMPLRALRSTQEKP